VNQNDNVRYIVSLRKNQIQLDTNDLTKIEIQSFDDFNHIAVMKDKIPVSNNHFTVMETDFSDSLKDTLSKQNTSHGYVLPYQIFEQQTAAAQNLWSLQYWANTVNMKVVEPFISSNTMNFIPVVMGTENPMRFSDLYDKQFWNKQSTLRNCSELVEWEKFLRNAPKQVILAFVYNNRSPTSLNGLDNQTVSNPDGITGQQTCKNAHMTFPEVALDYFRKLGFSFVRKVCINVHNPMRINELSQYILSPYDSNDVTVIFPGWSGIRHNKLNIQGLSFNSDNTINIGLLPSEKIVQDSGKYLKKLIPDGRKYFGTMVRTENVYSHFVNSKKFDSNVFFDYMLECAANLSNSVFAQHSNWGRTLAIDLGRLGSIKFLKNKFMGSHKNQEKLYNGFFDAIFSKNWTINEYEGSFKQYLGIDDPAYVAQIQRTIAARSNCLVMVGGESLFQESAITFHKNFHPNVSERCIIYHCYYPGDFNLRHFLTVHGS